MCSKIRNGADVHINAGGVYRVGLKTQPESKCPELLANYCDMLLRKTPLSKKLTSEEIEAKLKEVVRPSCHRSYSLKCYIIMSVKSYRDFTIKWAKKLDEIRLYLSLYFIYLVYLSLKLRMKVNEIMNWLN